MRHALAALTAGLIAGCQPQQATNAPGAPAASGEAQVVDMHTSRNALDWSGTYEGLLACADCAGTRMRLTLDADGGFEITTRRLVRDAADASAQGRFSWEPDGNTIALDAAGDGQRFAVGEGRIARLEPGQARAVWDRPDTVLAKSSPDAAETGTALADLLEDHRWKLAGASDAANRRIEALFPDPQHGYVFGFAGSRLHVQGGCNGLRGGFVIDADGRLTVTGAMSTMMACAAPLMAADTALAALLAGPMEPVVVRGAQPALALLTKGGDALVLTGELTPEARFGAPTLVFLEIAPRTVPCAGSARGDGQCLEVRERAFDEKGLPVETPVQWQVFEADIEGYEHQPGVRNVLRVKRFQPGAAGTAAPIYVLDLVVESEIVPK